MPLIPRRLWQDGIEPVRGWCVYELRPELVEGPPYSIHVAPRFSDEPLHLLDGGCWCMPERNEDGVWVHRRPS